MVNITVRNYRVGDREFLVECMNGMQQHIAKIDPLKRSLLPPRFVGEKWVNNIFKKIKKNGGVVLIAEYRGEKAGCAAGIIKKSTNEDLLDTRPFKDGRIIELFVDATYRGKNIGFLLVKKIEKYFHRKGCLTVELGCLATNAGAYKFYKKHGYSDKYMDMYKKLQ